MLKMGFLIRNANEAGSEKAHLQDHKSIVVFDSSDPHIAMRDPEALELNVYHPKWLKVGVTLAAHH